MRVLGILVAICLTLVVAVPASFALVGTAVNASNSGSVVITPGGSTIIIGPPIPISPTKDPVIRIRTIRLLGLTITYIDTTVYWTNGMLSSKSSVIEVRDRQGRLMLSTGTTYKYDLSGKLISPINLFSHTYSYNRNGTLSEEVYSSYNYDALYKALSSDRTVISYAYTDKGELQKKASFACFYDARGRQVSSSVSTWSYSYNDNSTLKEEVSIYQEKGADNKIRAYSKNVTEYEYLAGGDTYQLHSCYDINGKLVSKFAQINISDDGQTVNYRVAYDLDADGNVTYTHVYDANNNEMGSLGGSGFKTPVDIIGAIRNPAPKQDDLLMDVNGDIFLNSNKQWDNFSNLSICASGNITIAPNNNYDIYVEGDMTMTSSGMLDLSGYNIYVTGSLTINAETLISDSSSTISAGDNITINVGNFVQNDNQGVTISGGNSGEIVIPPLGNNDASGTIVINGDAEVSVRMDVTNTSQLQKQQLPQGVTSTGSMVTIQSQAMPIPQGGQKAL